MLEDAWYFLIKTKLTHYNNPVHAVSQRRATVSYFLELFVITLSLALTLPSFILIAAYG